MESIAGRIGGRLKSAREKAGLTQQQLADQLGFEHRQTLAAVEAGERRLSAEELIEVVRVLGLDLDYFTDGFRLVGEEARFSFRARPGVAGHVLDAFEERAGRWIALYRELGRQQGTEWSWLEPKLALTPRSTFEDAQEAGTALCEEWGLGEKPAEKLQDAVENRLRGLVLFVDAPTGVSGAASQVPGLNTVLVNRREPEGRRSYDLAHEVFHLLTWHSMPPARVEPIEVPKGGKGHRVEQLADNFAAALLMPENVVQRAWWSCPGDVDIHERLNRTATDLRVSAKACKWRLHNVGILSKADLLDIDDDRLVANGRTEEAAPPPACFSRAFVERVAVALNAGRLSVRRSAELLAVSVAELAELLHDHGFEPSFEA
jgi:transcriptional regulator with XRE-family HTH domain